MGNVIEDRRTSRTAYRTLQADLRMTERDLWILEALAKMRFVTTMQLARLFFAASRWAANKRMRKLLDAGLVKVWIRNLSQDNVYSLTRKGLTALDRDGAALDQEIRLPRELDGNLDHLIAINEVRIVLALGLGAGAEILWWKS